MLTSVCATYSVSHTLIYLWQLTTNKLSPATDCIFGMAVHAAAEDLSTSSVLSPVPFFFFKFKITIEFTFTLLQHVFACRL